MRCIRCNRPIAEMAASVQTRAGVLAWGPKCAKVSGLLPAKASRPVKQQPVEKDPAQIELECFA